PLGLDTHLVREAPGRRWRSPTPDALLTPRKRADKPARRDPGASAPAPPHRRAFFRTHCRGTPCERIPNSLATCPCAQHDCGPATAKDCHAPLVAAARHHRAVVRGLAGPRTRSTICRPRCRLRLALRVAGRDAGRRRGAAAGGIP